MCTIKLGEALVHITSSHLIFSSTYEVGRASIITFISDQWKQRLRGQLAHAPTTKWRSWNLNPGLLTPDPKLCLLCHDSEEGETNKWLTQCSELSRDLIPLCF